jgi:hypothetical protein
LISMFKDIRKHTTFHSIFLFLDLYN